DVAGPAGRHEHDPESQRVAGEHPLQIRLARAEPLLDGGKGDVHDAHAHQGHEDGTEQNDEDAPACRVGRLLRPVRDITCRWLRPHLRQRFRLTPNYGQRAVTTVDSAMCASWHRSTAPAGPLVEAAGTALLARPVSPRDTARLPVTAWRWCARGDHAP